MQCIQLCIPEICKELTSFSAKVRHNDNFMRPLGLPILCCFICLVNGKINTKYKKDSYVKEVLKEQLYFGWDGLTKEVFEYCQMTELTNACTEPLQRAEVKEVMIISHLKQLK